MKNIVTTLVIFLMISTLNFGSGKSRHVNQSKSKDIVPGKFVVKFKKENALRKISQTFLNRTITKFNVFKYDQIFNKAKNSEIKEKLNLDNVYVMETSTASDIWNIVMELRKDPNVEYAEPVYIDKLDSVEPNDPLYTQQQHLPQVHAPEAWGIQFGSPSVIIGIIDSGVDWDHEDLAGAIWTNVNEIPGNGIDDDNNGYIDDVRGWDFVTGVTGTAATDANPNEDSEVPDNNPMDFDGHGTHVSGIAAGQTNNNIGIASVSSGASIMPLRIGWHGNDGTGYVSSEFAAQAYIYAADNGAHITNQSSGNSGQLIVDAARYAFMHGVLIVESAGNGEGITPSALGSQPWVISVASVNKDDQKAYYSSFGKYVTVSAPGGEIYQGDDSDGILSTIVYPSSFYGGAKYVRLQGTSMASPVVASVAGLVKAHEPGISVVDLFTRIQKTADNIDAINPDYVGMLGSGRVNVYRALTESITADPNFIIAGSEIDDETGNNNGRLDPGEQVTLKLRVRNVWQNAENVNVNLSRNEAGKISINSGSVSLGSVTGILDTTNWEKEVSFNIACDAEALPSSIKLNVDIAASGFNQTLTYYLSISPRILFVADFEGIDNAILDFSSEYLEAFNNNSIAFDFVQHSQTTINYNLLNKYKIVVWGCEWTFPSLDSTDRVALRQFLDNGGSLFLSGQDIAWDLSQNPDNQDSSFLSNYLKANFIADNAGKSTMYGITGDPISDGISFDFFQKNRDVTQQFPDVIAPIETAVSTLNYDIGTSGAIRYTGKYRLVYFAFGGFEAITNPGTRDTLMQRIVDFLDGIEIQHKPLKDTEDTTGVYIVNINTGASDESVSGADLYWSNDNTLTFNKVEMTDLGSGNFQGGIPAQQSGTKVHYFIYVKSNPDNYSFTEVYSFNVGNDTQAPTISLLHPYFKSTVNAFGPSPFDFSVMIDDNMGIDTSSAKLIYWVNNNNADSTALIPAGENEYTGTFSFANQLQVGDQVNYYFKANDISSNKNIGKSETLFYTVDTSQVIDGFENGTYLWDLGNGWGLTRDSKNNGLYSITDSPFGDYANNSNNPLTIRYPFNLSIYKSAELEFFISYTLEFNKDSLLIEITNDNGATWKKLNGYTGGAFKYKDIKLNISDYTGTGNENILFRFRVVSDSAKTLDGVYLDDVSITASFQSSSTGFVSEQYSVPISFSLSQNYPNPFNPSTTIKFDIPEIAPVTLKIYDILGREVKTLINNEIKNPGSYEVNFHAGNSASGIYFYRLKANNYISEKKMILLK